MSDQDVQKIVADALDRAPVDRWEASAYFKKQSVYDCYAKAVVKALRKAGLLIENKKSGSA